MKLKVYVIDLEIPPRVKKWGLRIGIPFAVLLGGSAIAYASGLVTWTNGQTLNASDLNANFTNLQGQITTPTFGTRTPSAFRAVLNNTSVSVPSVTDYPVTFDNVLYDIASEYDASSGTFVPKNAGTYLITCGFVFPTTSTASEFGAGIMDGSNEVDFTNIEANGGNDVRPEVTTMTNLAAGDKVTCYAYQTTGASEAPKYIGGPLGERNRFSAARLY